MEQRYSSSQKIQPMSNTSSTKGPRRLQYHLNSTTKGNLASLSGHYATAPVPSRNNESVGNAVKENTGSPAVGNQLEGSTVLPHQHGDAQKHPPIVQAIISFMENTTTPSLVAKEQEIQDYVGEIYVQKDEIIKLHMKTEELKNQKEYAEKNLKRTQKGVEKIRTENNYLRKTLTARDEVVKMLTDENDKLTSEHVNLSEQLISTRSEVTSWMNKFMEITDKRNEDLLAHNAELVKKDNERKAALDKVRVDKKNIKLELTVADEHIDYLKAYNDKLTNDNQKWKSLVMYLRPAYDAFVHKADSIVSENKGPVRQLLQDLGVNPELNKDLPQSGVTDSELISLSSLPENLSSSGHKTDNKRSVDWDDELGDLVIDESPKRNCGSYFEQ
ncbi:unnamed protein product [Orchesella dallaii]|uniref:SWI5-dependent HO expression protein 3 n=1 Tax=Orchesella dallaii TaxID=48710 RepID=A0ABP1PV53_9HEXA